LRERSVDQTVELTCLLSAYKRNAKILYYSGDSLKEKVIHYFSKNTNEEASVKGSSTQEDEVLAIFLTSDHAYPIIFEETDDSDTSSEKSTEVVPSNLKPSNAPNFKVSGPISDRGIGVHKFIESEIDSKLNLAGNTKTHSAFEDPDVDDDEEPLFSEIWKRPSETSDDQNLNLNQPAVSESQVNFSSAQPPPGLSKGTESPSKGRAGKGSKRDFMRMAYQKAPARSDEQAFSVHMRQPILDPKSKDSLIEEEVKSSSNLNLSTSSRCYKPGIAKSKSTIYSQPSGAMSVSSSGGGFVPHNSNTFPKASNQQYFGSSPMQQMPPGMMPGHYPQFNYPVGMMPTQQQMYPSQSSTFAPGMAQLKHTNSTSMYTNPSAFEAEKGLDHNVDVTRNRHSANTPTVQAVTTASSSNITTGSTSPPMNDAKADPSQLAKLRFGTGMLKFFNQQHQYGFVISESDGSDIFFHYDDVKHTQLSKEFLRHATENYDVRFSFQILDYIGKYESSKKAVNINLLSIIAKNTDI
jgi:cold shock CspA family protein